MFGENLESICMAGQDQIFIFDLIFSGLMCHAKVKAICLPLISFFLGQAKPRGHVFSEWYFL